MNMVFTIWHIILIHICMYACMYFSYMKTSILIELILIIIYCDFKISDGKRVIDLEKLLLSLGSLSLVCRLYKFFFQFS